MVGIDIIGLGKSIPSKRVSNDDLAKIVDTSDEWITTRTGIKTRYFVDKEKNENQISMAVSAAKKAIQDAGIDKNEVGLIILATSMPTNGYPSTACSVMEELGIDAGAVAFDLLAACTGFMYALNVAASMIENLPSDRPFALVIGAEENSKILDFTDRSTCILFGDGAGAALIKANKEKVHIGHMGADGNTDLLQVPVASTVRMQGQAVFRFAVDIIQKELKELEEKSGLSLSDVDYFVCHQANSRILDYVAKHMDISSEKMYMNLDRYGNMGAASIPVALAEMKEEGKLIKGSKLYLVGLGGGLTWSSAYIEF